MQVRAPFLSIVLPVLNEAALVRNFLLHLREVAPEAEIIVVDDGSDDKADDKEERRSEDDAEIAFSQ